MAGRTREREPGLIMVDVLTQAVLLLTAYLGKVDPDQPKPLGPAEYGRLAHWLLEHGREPQDLLLNDPRTVLGGLSDTRISVERIESLLGRSAALGVAVEKWERAGLWILTRANPAYPARLKRLLKTEGPPVLIGCGNQSLLSSGGLAVVGSRDAESGELSLAAQLGKRAASESITVISGGARGVDETAMLAAVDSGGTAIGVLADHLLRAATSRKYRGNLMDDRLVLISPFNPEAAFDVGNAMARNRYIYCLAEAAVVVATSNGTGGTWNGAMLNLKEGWVPLWINRRLEPPTAGATLVEQGAHWLPEADFAVSDLLSPSETATTVPPLLSVSAPPVKLASVSPSEDFNTLDLYTLFVQSVRRLTRSDPLSPAQICEALDLHKSQVEAWLSRAVADGHLHKLTRPVRYAASEEPSPQRRLF
jgi:predicted Rossmann fold nucleotide-binding protein DprA/Smf involved in DNA uptake